MSTRPVPAATTFAALDRQGQPVVVRVSGVRRLMVRIRPAPRRRNGANRR